MTTKQRLTVCFNGALLLFVVGAARADMPPLLPTPAPQQVIGQLSTTDQWLTAFNKSSLHEEANNQSTDKVTSHTDESVDDHVLSRPEIDNIRRLLQQARETGDQRLLGQALYLLNQQKDPSLALRLLHANIQQALHRFEAALLDLHEVIQQDPANAEAWLMQASLYNVRGDYRAAQTSCKQLLGKVPTLLSGSCSSSVLARQGQAPRAYALLEHLYAQTAATVNAPEILHHAQVSLAEIADQLGNSAAAKWWSLALETQPKDLYTRINSARNAYRRGAYEEVVALSEHYEDIDALLLLRTLAETQRSNPDALVLRQQLSQRIAIARERGDTLHRRDQAAILLDVLHRPTEALVLALENWQEQREPEDTALLLRAALAANDTAVYRETCRWLQQWGQWHAHYPSEPNANTLAPDNAVHVEALQ